MYTESAGAPKRRKLAPDAPLLREDNVVLEDMDFEAEMKATKETLKGMIGEKIQDAAVVVIGRLFKGPSSGSSSQPDKVSALTKLLADDKHIAQVFEQVIGEANCTKEQFADQFTKAYERRTGERHPSDKDIEKLVKHVKAIPLYPFCKRYADSKDFYVLDNFDTIRKFWKKAD